MKESVTSATMVALLFFLLRPLLSPFRPISRLESLANDQRVLRGVSVNFSATGLDSLAEAGGFEPLHFRIGIREDSQPGAAGFELTHLN
jgi:hypothetical protein